MRQVSFAPVLIASRHCMLLHFLEIEHKIELEVSSWEILSLTIPSKTLLILRFRMITYDEITPNILGTFMNV